MVYVEFSAHISATFLPANTTRLRQSQRLFNSARSITALTHFGDLHFSEPSSPLSNTGLLKSSKYTRYKTTNNGYDVYMSRETALQAVSSNIRKKLRYEVVI